MESVRIAAAFHHTTGLLIYNFDLPFEVELLGYELTGLFYYYKSAGGS